MQYREGNVVLGVLARVHERGKDVACNLTLGDGIQEIETVNLLVDMVTVMDDFIRLLKRMCEKNICPPPCQIGCSNSPCKIGLSMKSE